MIGSTAPKRALPDRSLHAEGAPQFDVLIPCYNYGRFLAEAVGSVIEQNVNLRILIIDDASSDNSAEIGQKLAADDPRIEFRRHSVNKGHIATYNEGIEWAAGEFFLIVSADDILMAGALSRAAALFKAKPDLVLAYGRMLHFLDGVPVSNIKDCSVAVQTVPELWMEHFADGTAAGVSARTIDEDHRSDVQIFSTASFYKRMTRSNKVPASGTVSRTKIQKHVGGYLPTLPHAGDYEMWLRLAAQGCVGYIPRFQVAVRRHSANMSMQYDRVQDVLQRAQALRELELSCASLSQDVLRDVRTHVASEALRVTTVAIEQNSAEARSLLVAAAKSLDPQVIFRPIWGVYLIKRILGTRVWNSMRRIARQASAMPPLSWLAGGRSDVA